MTEEIPFTELLATEVNKIDKRLDRIEMAIAMMAQWMAQAQTGFGAHDAEKVEKILRGEIKTSISS
jgi:hypothetical protein